MTSDVQRLPTDVRPFRELSPSGHVPPTNPVARNVIAYRRWGRNNIPAIRNSQWYKAAQAAREDLKPFIPEAAREWAQGVVTLADPRTDRYGNVPVRPFDSRETWKEIAIRKARHGLWYAENIIVGAGVGAGVGEAAHVFANAPTAGVAVLSGLATCAQVHNLHRKGTGVFGPVHRDELLLRIVDGIHKTIQTAPSPLHDAIPR